METTQNIQKLMQAGDFEAALMAAKAFTKGGLDPRDIDGNRGTDVHTKTLQYVEGLYLQAVCARYLKRHEDAKDILTHLRRVAPDFGRGLQEEGHLNRDRGKPEAALKAYRRATNANPGLLAAWRGQSAVAATLGDRQLAAQAKYQADRLASADFLLESALAFYPEDVQLRLDFIKVLRKRQKFAAALEQAKFLYDRTPDNPLFLANLKTYKFTDAEVAQMTDLLDRMDLSFSDRVNLCFSLGKALEDRKDYAGSFEQYERGNDLKSVQSRYRPGEMTKELLAQIENCGAELFVKQGGKGHDAPA